MTPTIIKRDGTTEPFDIDKVVSAVYRCFTNGLQLPDRTARLFADLVANAVCNVVANHEEDTLSVEDVQRLVLQQLWAVGHFDAAEHYQNYRERKRQEREDKPIPEDYARAVAEDAARFPNPSQYYQLISKFARWREQDKRRETWREACDRVMNWFRTDLPRVRLTEDEWRELDDSLYGLETCCAMRVVQMAGPALERCHVAAFNCAYTPIDSFRSFAELFYVLMSGGGCGFSVEDRYVSQLPRVKYQKSPAVKHTFVVPDHTEGWCDALLFGLEKWFDGEDVEYDVTGVRKKNARLMTKGGRASGPEPLLEMLAFVRQRTLSRQGKVLTDLDCHDVCCKIATISGVGGVRRAATISVSDLDSQPMRDCKSGSWYPAYKWRSMANNSAAYDARPDVDTFLSEMSALVKSKSGERGIFNRGAMRRGLPSRRKDIVWWGGNPCMEIVLRPRQFCNLSIVVARVDDTRESLKRKVRLATYWGCMQKTATEFKYLQQEWHDNCEEEALLGVDITGHADCPLLRFGAPGRAELLRELAKVVYDTDVELSRRFGVNQSAANTCVKPSGDSAVFFDCGSGVSPWFDEHVLRWVREQADGPVAQLLEAEGVPCATAPENPGLKVFGFLRKAPPGATTVKDMTALDQLNNWLEWKENWAEHSVSCTVYVEDHEWPAVIAWVWEHFDKVSGLSFMPRDNGVYTYAPNERLTKEQYDEALAKFPKINWAKLSRYEDDDQTVTSHTPACVAGGCEI